MPHVIVSAGEHKGRYVGPNYFGMRTNPALTSSPEIRLEGLPYSLWTQLEMARNYDAQKASEIQAGLKAIGIESEQR